MEQKEVMKEYKMMYPYEKYYAVIKEMSYQTTKTHGGTLHIHC